MSFIFRRLDRKYCIHIYAVIVIAIVCITLTSVITYQWYAYDLEERYTILDVRHGTEEYVDYPVWFEVPSNAHLLVRIEQWPTKEYPFQLKQYYQVICGDTDEVVRLKGGVIASFFFDYLTYNPSYLYSEVIVNCSDYVLTIDWWDDYGMQIPEISHDGSIPINITVVVLEFWG